MWVFPPQFLQSLTFGGSLRSKLSHPGSAIALMWLSNPTGSLRLSLAQGLIGIPKCNCKGFVSRLEGVRRLMRKWIEWKGLSLEETFDIFARTGRRSCTVYWITGTLWTLLLLHLPTLLSSSARSASWKSPDPFGSSNFHSHPPAHSSQFAESA